jgi:hypothetical protein
MALRAPSPEPESTGDEKFYKKCDFDVPFFGRISIPLMEGKVEPRVVQGIPGK